MMRVADVEAQPHIGEARLGEELAQVRGRGQLAGRVFERDGHAALLGENAQVLEGVEGGVEAARSSGSREEPRCCTR